MSSQFGRCAELSARDFNLRVADPELFSGGGSVAALVAANACSLTLLVARLAARRRANAASQPAIITATSARIEELIETFYRAADLDLVVLDRLLAAQRVLKHGGQRADYTLALLDAARSPLELAENCCELVALIDRLTPLASRFTVSDLGAAAALAAGACRGALLTVDVNIALLRDEPGFDETVVEPLATRAADTFAAVNRLGSAIEAAAAAAISNTRHA